MVRAPYAWWCGRRGAARRLPIPIKHLDMPTLEQIAPCFIVEDLMPSVEFYRDALGFTVKFLGPEDEPFFAIVERDSIMVMLKAIAPEIVPQPNHTRHSWARWDAYVCVDDPDSLASEFAGRGVAFREELANTDDGLRGFAIYDHDRYVIFFGHPQ